MADNLTVMWVFIGAIHFMIIVMLCFLCYEDYARKKKGVPSRSSPRPAAEPEAPAITDSQDHHRRTSLDFPSRPRVVIRVPSVEPEIPLPTYLNATEIDVPPPKYDDLIVSIV